MKRRVRLVALILAGLLALDGVAWLLAERALRHGLDKWAASERAVGTAIAFGANTTGGWPLAATLAVADLTLGPQGLPGGMTLRAPVGASLSWLHPGTLVVDVGRLDVTDRSGLTVTAEAESWTISVPWATPDRPSMHATGLTTQWQGGAATAAEVDGLIDPTPLGLRLSLAARDVTLDPAGALPPALRQWQAVSAETVLRGGVPAAATTEAASAQAWHDVGGAFDPLALALRAGPLAASFQGRAALDGALLPVATGVLTTRGLPESLDALAASGLVPTRAGQAARGVLSVLPTAADGSLALPLSLQQGRISVAGFPIARVSMPLWAVRAATPP